MTTTEEIHASHSTKLLERLRAESWYDADAEYVIRYRAIAGRLDHGITSGRTAWRCPR